MRPTYFHKPAPTMPSDHYENLCSFSDLTHKEGRSMFDYFEDKAGRWRWHLQAGNRKIMGDSGQGYESEAAARRAVKTFRALVANAGEQVVAPPQPRILIRRKLQPSQELLRTVRPKQPLPGPLRSALKVKRPQP